MIEGPAGPSQPFRRHPLDSPLPGWTMGPAPVLRGRAVGLGRAPDFDREPHHEHRRSRGWLRSRCAAWPADADLGLTEGSAAARALPDEISGISLKCSRTTDAAALEVMTAWHRWRNSSAPASRPPTRRPAGAAAGPFAFGPDAAAPATQPQIAAALAAARRCSAAGENVRAVELLAAAHGSRAASRMRDRLRPVAGGGRPDVAGRRGPRALVSRVEEELGGLLALVGDIGEGIKLIGSASDKLFQPGGSPPAAWQLRYEAAQWGLRTRTTPRPEAVAELKKIRIEAPEASAAWFHAGFELIFASATPGSQAADLADAEQLVRRPGRGRRGPRRPRRPPGPRPSGARRTRCTSATTGCCTPRPAKRTKKRSPSFGRRVTGPTSPRPSTPLGGFGASSGSTTAPTGRSERASR